MTSTDSQQSNQEKSVFGVIIHSFFVIPFLIAVFSVLFFVSVRILTVEKQTVYDYIEDVKTGGLTKRWQAAFELSKILANPEFIPQDERFVDEMSLAYRHSMHDDDRVRQYLALAMARTGNSAFVDVLLESLKEEKEENLYAIIYSLGLLGDTKAGEPLYQFSSHPNPRIRLATMIALGNLGDKKAIPLLEKALYDSEPNVGWDAAISLAKLGSPAGREVLVNLLDREYLSGFKEVDAHEQTHVMLVVLESVQGLKDSKIQQAVKQLAESDQNMKVRDAALSSIQ